MSKSETETTASGAHSLQEYKCPDICELLTHHSLIRADPLQVLKIFCQRIFTFICTAHCASYSMNTERTIKRVGSVVRSDSGEIKGDTANSAGRHQT